MASKHNTFVYRLEVEYPPGSNKPGWEPEGWRAEKGDASGWAPPFEWPRVRMYFNPHAAHKRAELLARWGATVRVVPSNVVTWPGEPVPSTKPKQVATWRPGKLRKVEVEWEWQ